MSEGKVTALSKSNTHSFNKVNCGHLRFIEGLGIEGDAHAGKTVKHRSRVKKDPTAPNLRQVHFIHTELFEFLEKEFNIKVKPGDMGENVTTTGLDLLSLPTGSILNLGEGVSIEITGLRNPCTQLNSIDPTLMSRLVQKEEDGSVTRLAGVMGVVLSGGIVRQHDPIQVVTPKEPYQPLKPV